MDLGKKSVYSSYTPAAKYNGPWTSGKRAFILPIHCAAAVAALAGACTTALAQDYNAIIQQQMNAMDQIVNQAQQNVGNIVQQRMRDPQVQKAYREYVAQSGDRPAMDFPTFTYNYVYTRGFTREGTAQARANEAGIAAKDR